MIGVLLSLVPFFGWGTGDYVASKLSKYDPVVVNLFYSLVTLLFVSGLILIFGIPEITTNFVLRHALAALLVNIGFITFVKAFSFGVVGPVSSISNAYAIVTALASAVLAHEVLGVSGWLAIGIVIAGVTLISYEKTTKKGKERLRLSEPITYALVSLLLFGLGFYMFDVASQQEWYQDYALFQTISVVVSFVIFLLWRVNDKVVQLQQVVKSKVGLAGAAIATVGTMGFFAAINETGSATVPAVVSAASPLVTSVWARVIDHEILTFAKRAGAVIVVMGVMLLSL